ncbi:MAG: glycosyltransferase family 9 protein [bacterium]
MERILVIQLARMGDLAQSLFLCRDLHEEGHAVSLLVDARCAGICAQLAPWLERVFTLDMERYLRGFRDGGASWVSLWESLARELGEPLQTRFDRAINLNFGRLPASVAALFRRASRLEGFGPGEGAACGAPWLAAFSRVIRTNRRWNRFHLTDMFRRHAQPNGRCSRPETRAASPGRLASGGLVGLQPGTRSAKRTWPPEAFAEVARGLLEDHDARVVVLGDAGERAGAEAIRERSGGGASVEVLAGKTSLADLVRVLRECDLLISGDTGTLHLAAWLGVPSLAIYFGPAWLFETGPYGAGHTVVQAEPPCAPCRETEPCSSPACGPSVRADAVRRLLRAEPFPEGAGVRAYRSEWIEGWMHFRPVSRSAPSREEILAYLHWGALGEWVGMPSRFPSMELALRTLLSAYRLEGREQMPGGAARERAVPAGTPQEERERLETALQKGCRRLGEMLDGDAAQEPVRFERTAAGAGALP